MIIPTWLLKIRGLLTKLTDFLIMGRQAGAWSQDGTPRFLVGNPAPAPFLGGIKETIKGKIVEAGLNNVRKQIDTPEERKVIIEGIHVPGLPQAPAWLASFAVAIGEMILDALSSSDPALLMSDWRTWLHALFVAFVAKFLIWLKQDSHNSTAVLKTETVKGIAEIQG